MVRKTRNHRRVKRGGGFFNTVKRWASSFRTPRVQPTVYLNTNHSNLTSSLPPVNRPVAITVKNTPKPKRKWFTMRMPTWKRTPAVSAVPNTYAEQYPLNAYNTMKNSIQKELYFAGKSLDGQYVNVPKNQPVPILRPEEKHELRKRLVRYGLPLIQRQNRTHNPTLKNQLNRMFVSSVFGHNNFNGFRKQYSGWSGKRSAIPGKRPTQFQTEWERFRPALYYTDREFDYIANTWDLTCNSKQYTSKVKTLNTEECVYILTFIDWLSSYKMDVEPFNQAMYIVLHPHYIQMSGFQRGVNRFYPEKDKTTERSVQLKYLTAHSSIIDAFSNRGVQLVHPRLGWILQREAPELWTMSYNLPFPPIQKASAYLNTKPLEYNAIRKETSLNKVLRIIVLTLQKYAILRRYAWAKSPELCSQVYEVPFTTIAAELLRPDLHGELYGFNLQQFEKELYDNQIWAIGTTLVNSLEQLQNDIRIQTLFETEELEIMNPPLPWMTEDTRQAEMRVRIPPLPEMEEFEERFGSFNTYSGRPSAASFAEMMGPRGSMASVAGTGI